MHPSLYPSIISIHPSIHPSFPPKFLKCYSILPASQTQRLLTFVVSEQYNTTSASIYNTIQYNTIQYTTTTTIATLLLSQLSLLLLLPPPPPPPPPLLLHSDYINLTTLSPYKINIRNSIISVARKHCSSSKKKTNQNQHTFRTEFRYHKLLELCAPSSFAWNLAHLHCL
ncbi:hypothetical protein EYC84_001703 [Monilinia fructicola]|uniref:Uncharacterized protein n=1 Tax=Monilinia fructicola TaxID=38448 RepID=A0A5M9JQF3_MONFR|nr:hypothetical protein EYC84_001703 [Monilinia fructicola]